MGFYTELLTGINGIFLCILGPQKNWNSQLEAHFHQEWSSGVLVNIFPSYYPYEIFMKLECLQLLNGLRAFFHGRRIGGWGGMRKGEAVHQRSAWQGTTHEHLSKKKIKIEFK